MKKFLSCVVCGISLLALSSSASEPGHAPFFGESFEVSLESAKKVDQSLFVYFCKPESTACQYMDYEFSRWSVGNFLNTRFINVKINVDDEESNGPDLATRYKISSHPTYLILDHNGKVLHEATRAMEGSVFIDTISWLTGETEFPMAEHDAKYEAGERNPVFVQQYLLDARTVLPKNLDVRDLYMEAWGETQDKYTAIAQEYLASREPQDLINLQDFAIVKAYSNTLNDPGIELLLENFDAFVETTSMEQVSETVLKVALDTALLKVLAGDETYLDVIESLEEEPLKKATDWQRNINPESWHLPENMREPLKKSFNHVTESSSRDSEE
ncbi:MAG: hypothetical protein F4W92_00860 [Gammaproteobacteria bacterium]|nr:hypothetical protein [Gammaproteobacteria bacterium]